MDIVDLLHNNYYNIKICNNKELIKLWLHRLKITYALNNNVHKSDSDYYGRDIKCCFCSNKSKWALFNGYHNHCCTNKHYFSASYFTVVICKQCFDEAINQVIISRLVVFRAIKTYDNVLNSDIRNIIMKNFILATRYYRDLYFGYIDL